MNNEYNIMKQKIRFKLTDRYLVLLICFLGYISTVSAQSHKISGVVVDEGKSPIIGAVSYTHLQAGIGWMSEDPFKNVDKDPKDWGVAEYRGALNRNCVTIAEVLKSSGYHTYMTRCV